MKNLLHRKLLPQKFSGETGGYISSPQPMFNLPNDGQEGKLACQMSAFQEFLFAYEGLLPTQFASLRPAERA